MRFRIQSGLCTLAALLLFFALQEDCRAEGPPDAFVLKDVAFIHNTATFEPGAEAALEYLLEEMLANPSVSFEINCIVTPSGDENRDAKLSRDRAQALRNWLMNRGVAFYRLQIADPQTTAATVVSAAEKQAGAPAQDRIVIARIHKSFPVAEVLARTFRFEPVADGQEVIHDFQLVNKGDAPLNISKVRTG